VGKVLSESEGNYQFQFFASVSENPVDIYKPGWVRYQGHEATGALRWYCGNTPRTRYDTPALGESFNIVIHERDVMLKGKTVISPQGRLSEEAKQIIRERMAAASE
jgi:hypothetical protein